MIGESRRWSSEPVKKAKQNPHTHTFPLAQAHMAASRQGGDMPPARVEIRVNLLENENHCGKQGGSWLSFFLSLRKHEVGFLPSSGFVLYRNVALKRRLVVKRVAAYFVLSCPASSLPEGLVGTCVTMSLSTSTAGWGREVAPVTLLTK